MKSKNKKIKSVALVMSLIMLVLVTGGIGYVLAQMSGTLGIGGNVSFTAGNIYATISKGTVSGGTLDNADEKLQAIVYDMNSDVSPETALATWTGLNINFNDSADDIEISFKITNNHTERNLKVSIGTPTGTYNNVEKSIKINNTEMTESKTAVVLEKGGAYAQVVITFSVTDKNASAYVENFSFDFTLVNTDDEATISALRYRREGDYIYFGSFPQTIKASTVEIIDEEPNAITGYYTGSDGEEYAKYTADYSSLSSSSSDEDLTPEQIQEYLDAIKTNLASDGTKMESGTDYYFKVEDLKWKIASIDENNVATIICTSVLKSQPYQSKYKSDNSMRYDMNWIVDENGEYILNDNGYHIDAIDYELSELRNYLTGEFYETTFTSSQKDLIQVTDISTVRYEYIYYTYEEIEASGGSLEDYFNRIDYTLEDTVYALDENDIKELFYNEEGEFDGKKYLSYEFYETDYAKATFVFTNTIWLQEDAFDVCQILYYMGLLNGDESADMTYEDCTDEQKNMLDIFCAGGSWWTRIDASQNKSQSRISCLPLPFGSDVEDTFMAGVVPTLRIQL